MYEKLLFTVIVISCLSGGTNSFTNYIQKIPNDLYIFNYFLQLPGFRFLILTKLTLISLSDIYDVNIIEYYTFYIYITLLLNNLFLFFRAILF